MKTVPEKVISWIIDNQLKTSGGIPFEWYKHEFALQPISDMHPIQGVNKCAQVGFSEMMTCKTGYLTIACGLNVGYTIHNAKAMEDFAKTKFDPILNANPILRNNIEGNTSKKVVKYYDPETQQEMNRFIHLVGAYNSASASKQEESTVGISFTADILIHDEASRSDPYVLDQLQSRVLNSDYGYNWKFDNPKYPGFGSDKVWQESDQMHWFVKCDHCRYMQYLDWYRLDKHEFATGTHHCWVDPDKKILICGKCQKPLNDEVRRAGEWVPKWKSKAGKYRNGDYFGKRGYWINQLMYIHHSIEKLLGEEEKMTKSVFANMVLGRPYIGSDIKVTRQNIIDNIQSRPTAKGIVCMGVDQGREKQYVIGDEYGIFKIGRANTWEEIIKLRDMYDAYLVMDANPETGMPKAICEKHPGKAWRAVYKPESDQSELAKFSPKNDRSLVLIRREEMFDEIADDFHQKKIPINIHVNELHEYINDWGNLIRMVETDRMGNDRFRWDQSSGPTDFAHATLYFKVAQMNARRGRAEVIQYGTKPHKTNVQPLAPTPAEIIRQFTKGKN